LREAREIGELFSPFETNPSLPYLDEVKPEELRRSLVFTADYKQEDPTFQLRTPIKVVFFQKVSGRHPVFLKRKDVRVMPTEVPAAPSPLTPLFKEELLGIDSSRHCVNLSSFFNEVTTMPSSNAAL
jgi:hypothetical protein